MLRPFGTITDAFEVPSRGCTVVVLDSDIVPGVSLHIGDAVAVVSEGDDPIRTTVNGLELGHRPGTGLIGVLLGPEVNKRAVRPGSSLMKEC
jgi:hypothetical protein